MNNGTRKDGEESAQFVRHLVQVQVQVHKWPIELIYSESVTRHFAKLCSTTRGFYELWIELLVPFVTT